MRKIEKEIQLIFDQIVKTDLDEIKKLEQYSQNIKKLFDDKINLDISKYKSCIASHLLKLSFANIGSPYKNKGIDYVQTYTQMLLGRYFKDSFIRDTSTTQILSDQTQPNEESHTINLDPKPRSSAAPIVLTPNPKTPRALDFGQLSITVNPLNLPPIEQIESVFCRAKEITLPTKNLIEWITTSLSNLIDDQNDPQFLLHIHVAMLQLAKHQGETNIPDLATNAHSHNYQIFKASETNNALAKALIACFEHKQKLSQTIECMNHIHKRTIQITFGLTMIFGLFFGLGSIFLMTPLIPLAMICAAINVLANMYFQKYLLSTLNQTQKNALNIYENIFIAILITALFLVATMALTTLPYPVLDAFVLSTLTSFIINQYASSKVYKVINLASFQQIYDSSYRETKRNLGLFLNTPNKSTKAIDDTNNAQEISECSLFRQPIVQNSQKDPLSDDDLNQIMTSILNSDSIKA